MNNGIGESLDDYLKEDGIYDEVMELAEKKLEDYRQEVEAKNMTERKR
jgi:hypothetical protein